MKITILHFLFLSLIHVGICQNEIVMAQGQTPPIEKSRPADFEYLSAPDSAGNRIARRIPEANAKNPIVQGLQVEIPYPIIFIHGLHGKADQWNDFAINTLDAQYGYTFGGQLDFCLNFDGDNSVANKNFYPTQGADLALYTDVSNPAYFINANYYYLNFAVGSDGSVYPPASSQYNVLSNEQAIRKQGLALKWAIYYVLQKTGRDKVVLMGHSMGGVAAREYLQNPYNWQPDGQHHVAKVVTTGTPHGGFSGLGLAPGISSRSDAFRDLKDSYVWSGDEGVYLYGGVESNGVMFNNMLYDFYNVDVNCNGIYGETITGLNQRSLPSNADYSTILGWCTGCFTQPSTGDGVVNDYNGTLNNFYPNHQYPINKFYYTDYALIEIHTDLTKKTYQNMQGLDEPNEYDLSYGINFGVKYTGFITEQRINSPYQFDYDDYKFSVSTPSNINVSINNISLSDLMVRILDANKNPVGTVHYSNGSSSINFMQAVTPGQYYFEIYGTPTTTSYLSPYNFILNKTTTTGINDLFVGGELKVYPNPATDFISITSPENVRFDKLQIVNFMGQVLLETTSTSDMKNINISNLPKGVYCVEAFDGTQKYFSKFIVAR